MAEYTRGPWCRAGNNSCVCLLLPGHEGAHECPECGATWLSEPTTFNVARELDSGDETAAALGQFRPMEGE